MASKTVNSIIRPIMKNGVVSGALRSKMVLYVVTGVAVFNLFGYMSQREFRSIIFFAVAGVLMACYTKNMIIVLSVATLATNVLFAGYSQRRMFEGFQDADEEETADEETLGSVNKRDISSQLSDAQKLLSKL
jgi:hypothetical protein